MPEKIAQVRMPDGSVREARIQVDDEPNMEQLKQQRFMDRAMFPNTPQDDVPHEPGMLDRIGRGMFQSAAAPQSAGDLTSLATGTPMIGETGVVSRLLQAMKGAPGMLRSAIPSRMPSLESVGRGVEGVSGGLPTVLDPLHPLRATGQALGRSMQETAAARPSPYAVGGTTPAPPPSTPHGPYQLWEKPTAEVSSIHARGGSTPPTPERFGPNPLWQKPVAENVPESIYARGGSTPAPPERYGPNPQWTKPTVEQGPDSLKASYSERPAPPSPGPLGQTPYSGRTSTTANADIVPVNASWQQGEPPAHATGGSGAHSTIDPHNPGMGGSRGVEPQPNYRSTDRYPDTRIIKPGPESDWLMRDVTGGGAVKPTDQADLLRQNLLNFMRSGVGKP